MQEPLMRDGKLLESGEGATNTGYGQIVCGPAGEKITPVNTDRGIARFEPIAGRLVVQVNRPGSGQEPTAAISRYEGEERFTVLAEGTYNDVELPDPALLDALNAAYDKAFCYHCRCEHYALAASGRRTA